MELRVEFDTRWICVRTGHGNGREYTVINDPPAEGEVIASTIPFKGKQSVNQAHFSWRSSFPHFLRNFKPA